MIYSIFTFVIITFSISTSFACGDVRLDKDPNVLGRVPSWQQGQAAFCTAFAAAQIYDAERFSTGDKNYKHITSPLALAIKNTDYLSGGGGIIDWSLKDAINNGTCDSKKVSDHIGTAKGADFIKTIDTFFNENKAGRKTSSRDVAQSTGMMTAAGKSVYMRERSLGSLLPLDPRNAFKKNQERRASSTAEIAASKKCSRYLTQIGVGKKIAPSIEALDKYLNDHVRGGSENIIPHIVSTLCGESKRYNIDSQFRIRDHSDKFDGSLKDSGFQQRTDSLENDINKTLERKKPVAITFCNEVVTNPSHRLYDQKTQEFGCKKDGGHAAVIVGSQKGIFGKCTYLVRDSFCSEYPKQNSAKIENLVRFGQTKSEACVDGQYWIDSDTLAKNIWEITSF